MPANTPRASAPDQYPWMEDDARAATTRHSFCAQHSVTNGKSLDAQHQHYVASLTLCVPEAPSTLAADFRRHSSVSPPIVNQ